MNDLKPVRLRAACLHLRHKMMYCDERHAAPGLVDDGSDTRVFFCIKTQDPLGPDAKAACPSDCTPGRVCYKGAPGTLDPSGEESGPVRTVPMA